MVLVSATRSLPRTKRRTRITWIASGSLAALMLALTFTDGTTQTDGASATGSVQAQADSAPIVAAAVADPTRPRRAAATAGTDGLTTQRESGSLTEEERQRKVADDALRPEVVRVASAVAPALSSYSFQETPQAWVNRVPSLSVGAQRSLLGSAQQEWPQMTQSRVTARGEVLPAGTQVLEVSSVTRAVKVSVQVRQEVTSTQGTRAQVRAYVVSLQRGSDQAAPWLVTDIT